jgi:hypothetical protein
VSLEHRQLFFRDFFSRRKDLNALTYCSAENWGVHSAIHIGNENHKTRMQRLGRIELAKICGIVRDQNKIVLACVVRDVPILPPCSAHMSNVVRFVARCGGDSHQLNAQTLIDQESHEALVLLASGVRTRRSGELSRQGCCLRGLPRSG